jgi:electron transfer flavoprotein beta subunit
MKIIVLVKQAPDTAQLSGSVDGLQLLAENGPRVINPWDEYALETAIQLKEAHGGSVTALCLGSLQAAEALKSALAMGADEAVLVADPALAHSDSLATARVLAAAIQKIGPFDLLVAGRSGIDGNTWATAVQVAALLNVPQISYVAALEAVDPAAQTITAVRLVEGGRETVGSRLPAAISVVKEINEPRYPSFMGIRRAAKVAIPTWSLADVGLTAAQVGAAGSQVQWPELSLPAARDTKVEFIPGSPAEAAKILVNKLAAENLI